MWYLKVAAIFKYTTLVGHQPLDSCRWVCKLNLNKADRASLRNFRTGCLFCGKPEQTSLLDLASASNPVCLWRFANMITGPKATSPVSQNSSNDFSGLKNFFYSWTSFLFSDWVFICLYVYTGFGALSYWSRNCGAIFQLGAAKKSCSRVILTSVYIRWPFEAAPLKRLKRWI